MIRSNRRNSNLNIVSRTCKLYPNALLSILEVVFDLLFIVQSSALGRARVIESRLQSPQLHILQVDDDNKWHAQNTKQQKPLSVTATRNASSITHPLNLFCQALCSVIVVSRSQSEADGLSVQAVILLKPEATYLRHMIDTAYSLPSVL